MRTLKQIDIKVRTYYFYNDIIDIENFDSSLLKIDKKSYKDIVIYNIVYTTIKKIDNYKNICSVNPLYLYVNCSSGYIEEKGVNKHLIFDSLDENKELLKKYSDVFNGIMGKVKEVSNDECDYEKDHMKTKFNSDDSLSLNKPLNFYNVIISIKSVFKKDGKLYPEVFLDDILYGLNI